MIQNRPILFNENDVRVLLNDPRRGGIRPAGADDLDVEQKTALHRNDLKCRCVEVGRELFDRFPAHSGDDLQLRLLVASEDADGGGGREALRFPVFGTITLFTFLTMFPLTTIRTLSGRPPSAARETAAQ